MFVDTVFFPNSYSNITILSDKENDTKRKNDSFSKRVLCNDKITDFVKKKTCEKQTTLANTW